MRQFRVPMPFGISQWLPEEAARKYLASIMDDVSYYWLARRIKYNEDDFELGVEEQKFKTLRAALAWALWHPYILEGSGVDAFHATCFLAELDALVCGDELIGEAVELPPLWERLGRRLTAVQ